VDVPEENQKLTGPQLDVRDTGLATTPPDVGAYRTSNWLMRGLSHLLAYTGAKSIFLRADSSGRLRVVDESAGAVAPASDVTIHDPTTVAQKLAVDAAGKLGAVVSGAVNVADPSTPAQKLAVDAAGKLGAVVSGAVTVSGPVNVADPSTPAQKLAVDAAGKLGAIVSGAVNIADPVTPAQKALVNASGELLVHDAGAGGGGGAVNIADAVTPAQTVKVSADGRQSVVIRDGVTDTRYLGIDTAERALVNVDLIDAAEIRRVLTGTVVGVPVYGVVAPTGQSYQAIAGSDVAVVDFGTAANRLVVLTMAGGLPADYATWVSAYDSDTSGGYTRIRACATLGAVYVFHCAGRYLDLMNVGTRASGVAVMWWAL